MNPRNHPSKGGKFRDADTKRRKSFSWTEDKEALIPLKACEGEVGSKRSGGSCVDAEKRAHLGVTTTTNKVNRTIKNP